MASLVATVVDGYNRIWELRGKNSNKKNNFPCPLSLHVTIAPFIHSLIHSLMSMTTDRRVENWLFMGSPLSTLFICLTYVMLVKVWGPAYMKNRPAFQFRRTLVVYNAIQVIFSTWLFYEVTSMTGRLTQESHLHSISSSFFVVVLMNQ